MLSASHVCTVILQIHELEEIQILYKMSIAGAMLRTALTFQSGCRRLLRPPWEPSHQVTAMRGASSGKRSSVQARRPMIQP